MWIANLLISVGVVLVFAGLGGLVWCVMLAKRAQAGELDEEETRAAFARISAVNMASMGGATLGLGMLLVGLIL
ncbi:MAG: hypothetical protein AAGF90_09305 [Pseudomonadota bacterium]